MFDFSPKGRSSPKNIRIVCALVSKGPRYFDVSCFLKVLAPASWDVPYYTIPYYTVLYRAILYCTALHCTNVNTNIIININTNVNTNINIDIDIDIHTC